MTAAGVLTVPIAYISMMLGEQADTASRFLTAILSAVNTAMFVYLFLSLRTLLVEMHNFHETSTLISILIGFNIAASLLDLLGTLFPRLESAISWLVGLAIVPLGLLSVAFAIKLLRFRDSPYRMLKLFAYLYAVTGICYAVVVLIPLGVITSAVCDILLAMTFFRTAEAVNS